METALSNEVRVVLSRWNQAPAIYEDNECGADTILVRVGSESVEKNYTWLAYDDEGEVTWSWNNVDHKKIYRYMEGQLSKPFKVVTVYAPLILDDELVLTNDICQGDPYVRIAYKKEYTNVYTYTYRTIGYAGSGAFAKASTAIVTPESEVAYQAKTNQGLCLTDTTKTDKGVIFTYPQHPFDVEITRIVNTTGASSTKLVHFNVNELQATFSYVVDGVDRHESGEAEQTVRLNQGSRVVFTPNVENAAGEVTYKWNLIAPLNTDYYNTYGGSVGRDGLTSEQEQPVCYFYNGGTYRIVLTVADGQCTSTVMDSAMYIDKNTVRGLYLKPMALEEEEHTMGGEAFVDAWIWPTLADNAFSLYATSLQDETYGLYDTRGVNVMQGTYNGQITLDASALANGIYLVRTCGKTLKINIRHTTNK